MDDLFLVISLLAIAGLVIGLIKPTWVKLATRKSVSLWFGSAVVIFFIFFGITNDNSSTSATVASEDTAEVVADTPNNVVRTDQQVTEEANPKTDTQQLEDQMSKTVTDATGDFSYRKLDVEKVDAHRPAGTKMLTVTVSVASIYNKNSFVRYSGNLSAELIKQAFAANLNAYDVFVWYKGETTDRYGNKEDSVITVYAMDKDTYGKINWNSFDADKLCDFLQQEEKVRGIGEGPACNVLVNMQ